MEKYFYQLYGFHISSEIKLEEALPEEENENIDIYILKDKMPKEIQDIMEKMEDKENPIAIKNDGMWFRIDEVADYLVEKGNKIIVNPLNGKQEKLLKTYLLGSAFGYYFALNNIVAVHGSAVAWKDKGIIVTGDSGAGKSTITMGLLKEKYEFIADDVSVLSYNEKGIRVNLAYPQQKLCRDAAIEAGYDLNQLIYIDEDRDKFAQRLKEGFRQNGADLKYIFELQISQDIKELQCVEVTGQEKLMMFIHNIFRGESAFKLWGMPSEYMKKCLRLAKEVPVYRIIRPSDRNTAEEILDFIRDIVKEKEAE